ncbi:FCD domain-containing protein [uncultured Victivallis sp.]|uniref:FadR/GntR family transcriptional regulator n=1 Tax=uncultured Victivallis sp. TaxID=354118 RepID=UPI0025DC84E5|nr:FCD domain-containing protein [uncultured Victivallis sp.]
MIQRNLLKRFERYLIEGGFQPGDKLPVEQDLAEHFGVARSTIREIIIHLCLQGVLERHPNRGTILTIPACESIGHDLAFQLHWLGCGCEELKAARLMLESTVAAEVIRCITPAQLDRLIRINRKISEAEADPAQADVFDLEFHLTLMEIAGNRLIQVFSQVISLLFSREYREQLNSTARVRHSVESHQQMIQAIRAKDLPALHRLIYEHITPL